MKRDYPDHPIVAVGVVVLKGDEVLLIRRGKEPKSSEWSIPGGAQILGETVREAAVREVLEETSVHLKNIQPLEVVDFIDRDKENYIRHHYTLVDFVAEYDRGDLKAGDDAREARWVAVRDLTQYTLWSETIKIIYSARKQIRDKKETYDSP